MGMSGARNVWLAACCSLGRTATWRVRRRDSGCETERTSSQQQLDRVPGAETAMTAMTGSRAAHSVGAWERFKTAFTVFAARSP
jgi:hypothetical protein